MKPMPTQERLKELFNYDPETGLFTRLIARAGLLVGTVAGHKRSDGYIRISVDGEDYRAHRLAWVYVYGAIPDDMMIDHINHAKDENRISNLRLATNSQNTSNQKGPQAGNKLGVLGVYKTENSFRAEIRINKQRIYLGKFRTLEAATEARRAAEIKHQTRTSI